MIRTLLTRSNFKLHQSLIPLSQQHQLIRFLSQPRSHTPCQQESNGNKTIKRNVRKIIPPPTAATEAPYVLYHKPRRWQSIGLTTLAGGQAAFWTYAATLSTQLPTTTSEQILLSPIWTVGGFGLSALFAWMVTAYMRRLVAHIDLMVNKTGPVIRITPHGPLGRLGNPVTVCAKQVVAGPSKDKSDIRHWTFGVIALNKKRPFYYILDMKKDVDSIKDFEGLRSIVNGGDVFMNWSQKRDARFMKQRWREWKNIRLQERKGLASNDNVIL